MNKQPVMVQIADYQWTLQTLHLACTLACQLDAEIALLKLQPVQHLGWLGSDFGQQTLTSQASKEISSYQEMAEDYGVAMHLTIFQYAILPDAISDAATHVNAQVVFAKPPANPLLFWEQVDFWFLRRRLKQHNRQLYTTGNLVARLPMASTG